MKLDEGDFHHFCSVLFWIWLCVWLSCNCVYGLYVMILSREYLYVYPVFYMRIDSALDLDRRQCM